MDFLTCENQGAYSPGMLRFNGWLPYLPWLNMMNIHGPLLSIGCLMYFSITLVKGNQVIRFTSLQAWPFSSEQTPYMPICHLFWSSAGVLVIYCSELNAKNQFWILDAWFFIELVFWHIEALKWFWTQDTLYLEMSKLKKRLGGLRPVLKLLGGGLTRCPHMIWSLGLPWYWTCEMWSRAEGIGIFPTDARGICGAEPCHFYGFNECMHPCRCIGGGQVCSCANDWIIGHSFESNVFVMNSLIDMYAKCGSMDDTWRVFNKMPSPITTYHHQCHGLELDVMLFYASFSRPKYKYVNFCFWP